MSINFFRADCQSTPISLQVFGLCDNEDGTRAYADGDNPENWIAKVKNDDSLDVFFTAIDKCVLQDNEYVGRGRCDGMLTTHTHLYLVELKNLKKRWQQDAIDQLESTIQFLIDNHDISRFKKRKAFASNKKRDKFVVIDNEFNKAFYTRTGFRIDIQAEIVII